MMIFSDGFETGDFSQWTNTTSTGAGDNPLIVDIGTRKGNFSCFLQVNGAGFSIIEKTLPASKTTVHCRAYTNFGQLPAIFGERWDYIINFRTTPYPEFLVSVENTGVDTYKWAVYNSTEGVFHYGSDVALFAGTWYSIEFEVIIDAVAGAMNLYVDNIPVVTQTGLNTGTDPITEVWLRANPSTPDLASLVVDDIVVADEYIGLEQAWFGMTGNMTWK